MRKLLFSRWGAVSLAAALCASAALVTWCVRSRAHALRLADGTEVYFRGDTSIEPARGFPKPREIRVDGDLYLKVPGAPEPLLIRSRLLLLTVTGPAALRVTAFSSQTGEEAEVLGGSVVARKAYPSTYEVPDTLAGGDMVMVNRTIDLMEKEKDTPSDVKRWSDELMRAAGPPSR